MHLSSQSLAAVPPYRKLVSVRRISLVKPIASSDTHEVVMIDGWPVVVGKRQFVAGQQVLYFAIDCVLPLEDERYEPYRFSQFCVELHGEKGWAVQTVEHEGHISQGMVFCIDDSFPEITRVKNEIGKGYDFFGIDFVEYVENVLRTLELMEYFQIRKWITFYPIDGGISLGRPPSFLPTTKAERAQNITDLWKTHGDTEFQITEILDGIPMIVYDVEGTDFDEELPGVIVDDTWPTREGNGVHCRSFSGISSGNHDYAETKASTSWKVMREQGILADFMKRVGGVCLAGVLCGEDILDNPHNIEDRHFYAYAMADTEFKAFGTLDDNEAYRHRAKWDSTLELPEHVPKLARRVRLSAFAHDMDELMEKAQGGSFVSDLKRMSGPPLKRKGLVFRALDGSFSFKVIANNWLLDETEKLRGAGEGEIVRRPGPHDCT
ncbi:hypothetical protein diail_11150 [Diaporthe ilicicola]|nr:hypothetical protein diail_11150 [Diaporthe ilicicola]